MARLEEKGIEAENLFLDGDMSRDGIEHNSRLFRSALAGKKYDVVMIGAGVRGPPEHLELFEILVNDVIVTSPGTRIAFNSYPLDTADAIERVLWTGGNAL